MFHSDICRPCGESFYVGVKRKGERQSTSKIPGKTMNRWWGFLKALVWYHCFSFLFLKHPVNQSFPQSKLKSLNLLGLKKKNLLYTQQYKWQRLLSREVMDLWLGLGLKMDFIKSETSIKNTYQIWILVNILSNLMNFTFTHMQVLHYYNSETQSRYW